MGKNITCVNLKIALGHLKQIVMWLRLTERHHTRDTSINVISTMNKGGKVIH